MKTLTLFFALFAFSAPFAYANCELTTAGAKQFSRLDLNSCGDNICVSFQRKNGSHGTETMIPAGCSESICYSFSPSFIHIIPTETSSGSQYLGERSSGDVWMICRH
jgi:hypothetical protein